MEIIVKLRPDVGSALSGRAALTPEAKELNRVVEGFSGALVPLHPGEADPLLAPYYRVEVEDAVAERVLAALLASDAVEGAYKKPADEPA